jgi:hypothetical protein
MSRDPLDRRQFLTLPLGLFLAPLLAGATPRLAGAEPETRRTAYGVDVGVLWDAMTFHLPGTLEESVDRAAGRYEIRAVGQGARIQNRIESRGVLVDRRWAPLEATSWFQVAGRETRSQILYDYDRRRVEYHFKGETFLLRRMRVVDDTLTIPPGLHVDDVITAVLNYADERWPPQADGDYHTHVVRRQRPEKEGPDDVAHDYRAELVPLVLKVGPDPETGKPAASFDLTRFSSWAKERRPARILFGPDRRPESIVASLILGTSITIRLRTPV